MDFDKARKFIEKRYGARAEFLWDEYPSFAVFRHEGKKAKWFALLMRGLENAKFGRKISGTSDVINLKISPDLGALLRDGEGIFAGYHMNKKHWISVCLDTVDEDKLADLIDESFGLTK